ncbi:gonadotropin-releasing hormone receptor [Plakobranchus ocellatus]|uniref:Gonadotropin-releasing hormone receptor n=1 Tax=Plakobranchus ocellatus TaxID=259542 RepID=A0AAV4B233_9GAST|nr:gonadotropin-releasing hormone receptor [Plakobranchus ocellatus]
MVSGSLSSYHSSGSPISTAQAHTDLSNVVSSGNLSQMANDLPNKTLSTATLAPFLYDMNVSSATAGLTVSTDTYNMSNTSETIYQPAPTFTAVMLTRCILFGVMFVISFIGNVATLVQMRRLRRRKSTINTLIVNLALADLLVTFFCIAGDAAWVITVQWLAGNFMCKFVKYMQVNN